MDHGLELINRILEILGIEVCNILQNPGNIGNLILLIQSYPGNIGKWIFSKFPYPGNIGNMFFFPIFWDFYKKTRAEISRRMVRFSRRDLSSETDSGPKTKTVPDPNFQVTAATAAAAATTSQQLSHLARALDHHAQGPNIPFGGNPSLRLVTAEMFEIRNVRFVSRSDSRLILLRW